MLQRSILLASTIASLSIATPVFAQPAPEDGVNEDSEIVVTARRREELLQDVPISIAVFSQDQIDDRGITNAAELATYTPSLTATTPFGGENAAFALRGFTQEVRTTPSVASYFADVVSPRGGTLLASGDNPAQGAFFDLANVQILRGPQGTLFGRNTTGGAVLLVPQRPTDEFEGYAEASGGNYDAVGMQIVLNVPVNNALRFRVGANQQYRDGYLDNTGSRGPSAYSDVDYANIRLSMVADLAPNLENYAILTYSTSQNTGAVPQLFACDMSPGATLAGLCAGNMLAIGDDGDFILTGDEGDYNVVDHAENPTSTADRWQFINTTTWDLSDTLTVKNIISYAELEADYVNGIFGLALPSFQAPPYDILRFTESGVLPGYHTASQSTFTEELQFQGQTADDRFRWQAGVYYERSQPIDPAGARSANFLPCVETATPDCINPFGVGFLGDTLVEMDYENTAAFVQGSFDLSDQWSFTAGYRYTWDTTEADVTIRNRDISGALLRCGTDWLDPATCRAVVQQESEAPTWLLNLDFTPAEDVLLYLKYARGYRQGSVNVIGPSPYHLYEPEEVDAYEFGAKTRFSAGAVRGTLNAAAFYNDFTNQQLQIAFFPTSPLIGSPTTGIANAGSSTIYGIEIESSLYYFDRFRLDASYTYLNSELEEVQDVAPPAGYFASLSAAEGGPLAYTPEHKASITATYFVPVPETWGDVSAAVTYVYTDEQLASVLTPFGTLPSYELINFNLNWDSIAGSPVDASFFVTNATDERYITYVGGTYDTYGFESRYLGMPRTYGMRLRMSFGAE